MRALSLFVAGCSLWAPAWGTTLQRLSLGDMVQESTGIVRAKVIGSRAAFRGPDIYTYYQLQVLETLKSGVLRKARTTHTTGEAQAPRSERLIEVAIPGGAAQGLRQMVEGSPELAPGGEYVIFLWTSRSGLTQVIGLSQGLFRLTRSPDGVPQATRPAAGGLMLDHNGRPVADRPVSLPWSELRSSIRQELRTANSVTGGAEGR
jgi:hypothetical protein